MLGERWSGPDATLEEVKRDGKKCTDNYRIKMWMVDRVCSELTCWANEAPMNRLDGRIKIVKLLTHQTADAVKKTWLCGQVKENF
jgi:hypothetical protein